MGIYDAKSARKKSRKIGRYLVFIAIILAPLTPALPDNLVNLSLVLLLLTAGVLNVFGQWNKKRSHRNPWHIVQIALLMLCGATLLQAIPIPLKIVEFLSPQTYDIWDLNNVAKTNWMPISLAPANTWAELLKLLVYFLMSYLITGLFSNERYSEKLLPTVAFSGGIVCVVTLTHNLLGWSRPWNQFGPNSLGAPSTFINPNHLGAFVGICFFVSLSLALNRRAKIKWVYAGLSLICAIVVFISLSRGAIGSMIIVFLFFLMVQLHVRTSQSAIKVAIILVSLSVFALALVTSVAYEELSREILSIPNALTDNKLNKSILWEAVPNMLREHSWVGVGKGAFQTSFTRFMTVDNSLTWTHLENGWLQVLVDWGIGVGLFLLGTVTAVWLLALRRIRSNPQILGPLSATLFLGIHNIVDFNLELTGVGVAALICLLALLPPSIASQSTSRRSHSLASCIILCICTFAFICSIKGSLTNELNTDTAKLSELMNQRSSSWDSRLLQAQPILLRHAADYFMREEMARYAFQEKRFKEGVKWINQALYLNPKSRESHLIAARLLKALGYHSQSILEYTLAATVLPENGPRVAQEMLKQGASTQDIMNLHSRGVAAKQLIELLINDGRSNELLQNATSESELDTHIRARAFLYLKQNQESLIESQKLERLSPKDPYIFELQLIALNRLKQYSKVLEVSNRALRQTPETQWLLTVKARALLNTKNHQKSLLTAKRVIAISENRLGRAEGHALAGDVYLSMKNLRKAEVEQRQVTELDPLNIEGWKKWADTLDKLGELATLRRTLKNAPKSIRQSLWARSHLTQKD